MGNYSDSLLNIEGVPFDVVKNIDILADAPIEFKNIVKELEQETNFEARAQKAQDYIKKTNSLQEIAYPQLGKYLADPSICPIEIWQQLYLLERSIPPRFGSTYTWFQRLKIFYDTYVCEKLINQYASYNGKKLYWVKGTKDRPTNHDKLVMGAGKSAADFYYWDDTVQGTNWDKMIKVEYKYCKDGSVKAGAEKYLKDKSHLYKVKLVILYVPEDQKFYMVDYNTEPYTITDLNIPAPQGLIEV